uniref:Melanoma antigen preferentially expressed in tumors n=1 Tax=Loxodonta africana TaxID=9785 RepID=G3SXB2_LOXAF
MQGSFWSRFISMNSWSPPRLSDLANQSLMWHEASAIASLELLPMELFPPFVAAVAGRHSETLKAMVQAWPFTRLCLGALMKSQQPHQGILKAVLDGLDVLLAQKIRPRRWKLKVLDLRENTCTNFWSVWSGNRSRASLCSLEEPEAAQPRTKRGKVDSLRTGERQPLTPLEVLIDLCFLEGGLDEFLTFLINRVKQRKGLLHLFSRKVMISAMPLQNIEKILKMVQLDCVEEVKLSTLTRFAPHLGQMVTLSRLVSYIYLTSCISPALEEKRVAQLTSQFLSLHQLQELYLDSVLFLKGCLDQVLRCLKTPSKTPSITNCLLSESDLTHLSLCLSTSHLRDLSLSGVILTSLSPEFIQVLLKRASTTLQHLDFEGCGILDSQVTAILPALGRCSQLITFSFCGNPVSMAVLESLLRHAIPLIKFRFGLFPTPLECSMGIQGTLHLGTLREYLAKLRLIQQELGRSSRVLFNSSACPDSGTRIFYGLEPILCPCHMPA